MRSTPGDGLNVGSEGAGGVIHARCHGPPWGMQARTLPPSATEQPPLHSCTQVPTQPVLRCSGRVSQLQTGPAPGLLSHTTAILCASSLHLSTALPVFIFLQPLVVGSGPPVPSPHSLGCSWLLLWTRPPQTLLPVTASGDPRLSRLPHSGAFRALCWWCHATAQFSRPPEAVPCSTGSPVTFLSGEMPPDPANPRSDGARCMKRTWHHLCSFPVCSICPGLTPLFFFF